MYILYLQNNKILTGNFISWNSHSDHIVTCSFLVVLWERKALSEYPALTHATLNKTDLPASHEGCMTPPALKPVTFKVNFKESCFLHGKQRES